MVVSFADGFEPGCLGGGNCGAMEVADCWLSARDFIQIVYGFIRRWTVVAFRLNVLKYTGAVGNGFVLRDSVPVGPLSRSVSLLLLLMWGCRGMRHILDLGQNHPLSNK